MKIYRFIISLAVWGLSLSPILYAQKTWTLEECIKYAKENNLQIKQQELAVDQAKNSVQQAKLRFIPTVNASVGHNMNWGKSVNINDLQITNQLTQSTSASLNTSIPLIEGMSKINSLKSSNLQLEISEQDVERLKDEITISITQAYLQVLLALEIEKSANESYKSINEQVERTRKLVDAGSQAYSSLLDIESQLAAERLQLVTAGNNVKSNYLTLMQLLDLPQENDFAIDIPLLDSTFIMFAENDLYSIYNSALALPQIKRAELALEKSKYDYKIQKGAAYPTVNLSAGYGTYYSDSQENAFFSQFNDNRNPSIGFGLSIPIFNGWRTNTAIRNARLNIKSAELELEKSHQQLYKDIQNACSNAQNAYEKYLAAAQNMKAGKESFSYVETKFNVGLLNGTDYIVAKTNLFKSESEYSQAKFQYILQLKILDFYRGIPIKL